MLNSSLKKESLERLSNKEKEFEIVHKEVIDNATILYELRKDAADLISMVNMYSRMITNTTDEMKVNFKYIETNRSEFTYAARLEKNANKFNKVATTSVTGGIATGVAVAALAPTVAMAVATTFGVASTGTAIASLSGAAATNAALAWLGGGALAAGGGGMAAGNALLALAGPVGWAIGGSALLVGGFSVAKKNKEIAEAAQVKESELIIQIGELKKLNNKVLDLNSEVKEIYEIVQKWYLELSNRLYFDYLDYTACDKEMIDNLISETLKLSELLNKRIIEE